MSEEFTITRAELLAGVRTGRAELDNFVAGLRDEQLTAPGPGGDWSIKEHLYHLAAWERKVLAQMHDMSIPAALGIDQAIWDRDDLDELNAAIAAQGRDLPLAETLAFCRHTHQTLLAAIERYPESDYNKPGYPPAADGHDPDGAAGGPMVGYIIGNTYAHYEEHLGYIKRLAGHAE